MMKDKENEEFTKIEGVDWRVIYDWGIFCVSTLLVIIIGILLFYLLTLGGAK